jgi:polar amino acid transport system substrate-binding protein
LLTETLEFSMRSSRLLVAFAGAAIALAAAGCAPQDDDTASTGASPSSSASCQAASLPTKTAGTLTIATDKPAYSPYFVDDNPSNGKGLESSVAYAVAKKLGYDTSKVKWVTAAFGSVIQPGPKPFDLDINQFSITDERKQAVDFSSGYYDVTQGIVTIKGSKAAAATSIADLKDVRLGAQVGTTSYQAITDQIKPAQQPRVYDDNDKAVLALTNGQVDALVLDLPTAIYEATADLDGGILIGQLPNAGSTPEQFGMVLEKGSKLTSCVSGAVDALRSDGTLAALAKQWITEGAKAPVLS